LHAAALDNKDRFVRLLLTHRADVNKMDASGERPIALALKNRSSECILIIREQLGECKEGVLWLRVILTFLWSSCIVV